MNTDLSKRLMTVDEAQCLSDANFGHPSPDSLHARHQRPSIWAWQTVAGALAQTITDEQVSHMQRSGRQK